MYLHFTYIVHYNHTHDCMVCMHNIISIQTKNANCTCHPNTIPTCEMGSFKPADWIAAPQTPPHTHLQYHRVIPLCIPCPIPIPELDLKGKFTVEMISFNVPNSPLKHVDTKIFHGENTLKNLPEGAQPL